MTVTEFTGATLPAGWTAQAPVGSSVDLPGGFLQLTISPGQSFNSLSGSINAPQGPLVWRAVAGAFDFAVGLAEEATNLPNQGLDLLGLTSAMNGIRLAAFSGAQGGDYRSDIGWFVRDQPGGVNRLSTSGDTPMGGLYGGPGWLRLAWNGVSTWTCYASHTGRSGSWVQLVQFAAGTVPTRFAIHATATPSGVDGRVQRVQRVVDLLARGTDDATDEPTVAGTTTLFSTDFTSGALPAWLTAQTANGGQVTTDVSGAELRISEAQVGSQAWLLGPGSFPPSHGMLLRYQLTEAGYLNAFWVPAVSVATTTDITGAETPDDKFGPGTSLLMEMPAREHAAQGILLRMLRRSPIRAGAAQTGTREFDGYTLMIQDAAAPVGTVGLPLSWLRMERVGDWLRVKVWLDGDPEPGTWLYQAQDHMRHGDQVALTLSHNDTVSGVGAAAVRLSQVEIYELELAAETFSSAVGFASGCATSAVSKVGAGTSGTFGAAVATAVPAKVSAGIAAGIGSALGVAAPTKSAEGSAAGLGGAVGLARATTIRLTQAVAVGGGVGRGAASRVAPGSGTGFGGGLGAHRPTVQTIVRPFTGIASRPDSGTIVRPFTGTISRP